MPDQDKLPITVVIPTRNEERNLPLCLSRLGDFADILIVDSASSDDTVRIAHDHGAPVVQFAWAGGFPKKRNWVLRTHSFSTPWVLFLDADEQVGPAFVAEVRQALSQNVDGFWLNYTTHFTGRILRHGVPQRKLALFRVGAGEYERIDDARWSNLDMEVHEHPQLAGNTGSIAAPIDHRDFRGIEHFIARHNSYSTWEANRYLQLHDTMSADDWRALTRRQRLKYRAIERWWFAPAYLLAAYVLRAGFLDGGAGLHYALLKFSYFQAVRLKIRERRLMPSDGG